MTKIIGQFPPSGWSIYILYINNVILRQTIIVKVSTCDLIIIQISETNH